MHRSSPRFARTASLLPLTLFALSACRGGEIVLGEPVPAGSGGKAGGAVVGGAGGVSGKGGAAGGSLLGGSGGTAGAAGTAGSSNGICGDGVKGAGEQCDKADRGTATCASATGIATSTGTLGCFANCTLDAKACTLGSGGAGGTGACGDGKRVAPEACDGSDVGTSTCATVTGAGSTGKLACFANCTLDASGCALGMGGAGGGGSGGASGAPSVCGDGKLSGAEACDGTLLGTSTCVTALGDPQATGIVSCHPSCLLDASKCAFGAGGGTGGLPGCGDGVKEGAEACDGKSFGDATCATATGNATATGTLACFTNCTLDLRACSAPPSGTGGAGGATASCGDGVKSGAEQCDVADFGAVTCATALGDLTATGTPGCFANCTIDAKGCVFGPGGVGGAGGAGGAGAGGMSTGGAGGAGPGCVPTTCQGKTYDCGDCVDNDGDGLVDQADPECLNPCDNAEKGFFLTIPGGDGGKCKVDCYFDQDSGSGNDKCNWDQSCDPVSVAPDYYPRSDSKCEYDRGSPAANTKRDADCSAIASSNGEACTSFCGPLVPNGCDCFGCCALPQIGGTFVWLGSTDNGTPSCDLENIADPAKCHPCTPVTACLNTCEECELCLGKSTLPASCYPPASTCGDGVVGGREQCDQTALGQQTCASFTGIPLSTGTLACAPNCTIDASGCQVPSGGGPVCGNGVGEGLEQCDAGDLRGAVCGSVLGDPAAVGTVACNPNCTLNGSGCTIPVGTCGDGLIRGFEQCDGDNLGGATCASVSGDPSSEGTVKCLASCILDTAGCTSGGGGGAGGAPTGPLCGDGVVNGAEACDGAALNGATCASVTGNPTSTGKLACFANCAIDARDCNVPGGGGGSSGSAGAGGGSTGPSCGNGVREGVEGCDKLDLGGATCKTFTGNPDSTGNLVCFANCLIDASGCTAPGGGEPCGAQICAPGRAQCGLACQPLCPSGEYCSTGCCTTIK